MPPEPRTPKSGTVLARSRPSRAERARWPHRPALTLAARGAGAKARSGRREVAFGQTKGGCS